MQISKWENLTLFVLSEFPKNAVSSLVPPLYDGHGKEGVGGLGESPDERESPDHP